MIELIHQKKVIVFGCGNPLFGDDGFGPAVIDHFDHYIDLPDHVACVDVGTSVREILFDILLSEKRPDCIIIVDTAAPGFAPPGSIHEISLDDISPKKTGDFSLHQFPTTNMLKELHQETDMDVRVLVVGIGALPETVHPGLSDAAQAAIPEMCRKIITLANDYSTQLKINNPKDVQDPAESVNGISLMALEATLSGIDYD